MTKGQKQVAEFMKFFGQATPEKPVQLNEASAQLRARLILEEALETIVKGLGLAVVITTKAGGIRVDANNLADIIGEKGILFPKEKEVDLVELADGLADLAYVGEFGTAVAAGIDLEPIQDEVHASNMTKAWTEEDVEKGKLLYPEAKLEHYGGNLYRFVRPDGKVIKSPNYRPAQIAPLVEAQKA